jgi:hypothetical protein
VTLWGALLHPVGPRPAPVYWRRRAVAVLGVVVAGVVVSLLVGGGGATPVTPPSHPVAAAGSPSTPPPAASSPTPRAAATSPSPRLDGSCPVSALGLAVATDALAYPPGLAPRFLVTVTDAAGPCRLAAGPQLVVTSGTDRIWAASDCGADAPLALVHGAQTLVTVWQRVRSAPGCSTTVGGVTTTAAGTYHLNVTLAGHAASARFSLD